MPNLIPESIVFKFTIASNTLLVMLVVLSIIKRINIFKITDSKIYSSIILAINTAFIIITILLEILKFYDPFKEQHDVMFRFLGITMTIAVDVYVYYNELTR